MVSLELCKQNFFFLAFFSSNSESHVRIESTLLFGWAELSSTSSPRHAFRAFLSHFYLMHQQTDSRSQRPELTRLVSFSPIFSCQFFGFSNVNLKSKIQEASPPIPSAPPLARRCGSTEPDPTSTHHQPISGSSLWQRTTHRSVSERVVLLKSTIDDDAAISGVGEALFSLSAQHQSDQNKGIC